MATVTADPMLQDEVNQIHWWHTIDLGQGIVTQGMTDTFTRIQQIGMSDDLTGKTVLDIGAWDGFFSFEAEKRGASRVVALDNKVWNHPNFGRKGFDLARRCLASQVEDVDLDVHLLAPERVGGTFDVVLFMGVLYHVTNPFLALQAVSSVCHDQLILETHVDLEEIQRPVLAFYPERECAGDSANWYGPNSAAVLAMLKVVGFKTAKIHWSHLDSRRNPVGYTIQGSEKSKFGRMVFHAWK